MSLDFNYIKVKNHDTLMFDDRGEMKVTSHSLLMAMMVIGTPNITEKNAAEVWFRLNSYEKVCGACRSMATDDGLKDVFFTADDVIAHIGLSTNVSKFGRKEYLTRLGRWAIEEKLGRKNVTDTELKGLPNV